MKEAVGPGCTAISMMAVGVLAFAAPACASDDFTLATARATAMSGNPKAEYFLGKCYAQGNGVIQDYRKAAEYLRESAAQGYAPAQANLGSFYAHGTGVPQDLPEAIQWYRKAANQGDALAEYCLGYAYAYGNGAAQNLSRATNLWEKAAEQGQVYAENALGQYYFHGGPETEVNRTNVNYKAAAKWLLKAAEHDYVPAMNNLAFLYQNGLGVAEDWPLSLKWYGLAARRGDAMAQANLGLMYEGGDGVPVDKVIAYSWFSLSAAQGNIEGKHSFQEYNLYHYLTPAQFEQARKLVAQFHTWARTNEIAGPEDLQTHAGR